MITIAERSLGDGMSSKSGTNSQIAVSVRQYINDLENPSFNYVPLFGQETTLQIRTILSLAARTKSSLRHSLQPASVAKKQHFLARVVDWFMITGPASSDENIEETKKTLSHLEQSSSQLATLFDVSKHASCSAVQSF